PRIAAGEKILESMLHTLAAGGYVTLDPPPVVADKETRRLGDKVNEREAGAPVSLSSSLVVHLSNGPIRRATPTAKLDRLLTFRSVHPLYGAFLVEQLGIAGPEERLQMLESVLEMPKPLLKFVRVPWDLPPGPLQTTRLDAELVQRGLLTAKPPKPADSEE